MGDLPPYNAGEPHVGPPVGPWQQPAYPPQPLKRPQTWPAIALSAIAVLLAIGALVVAFTRSPSATAPASSPEPKYTPAESAAAQQQLCDVYKAQARTVRSDTAGTDEALARISATNGAVMLYNAAANPALDANYRDSARALATAYGNVSALGSKGVATDAEWRTVLDDANAKDTAMRSLCGGG
nr:hypothetical protein [Mycobacterium sp. E2989]